MDFDFLKPVSQNLLELTADLHPSTLGRNMQTHTVANGFPDLTEVKIAVFGVQEDRRAVQGGVGVFDFDEIRRQFYALFPGNWHVNIADLGDIYPGNTVEDTYYVVQRLVRKLVEQKIIPVILGGSQDLMYPQYRAYDNYGKMVNIVNVDACFDLGDADKEINSKSYIGRMVVDQPYNLFNYSNVGYQTYFNAQEEIELIEKLYFEAYRLGEISADVSLVEPIMRDADIVGIDINSVHSGVTLNRESPPNGFSGKEICALARYAGISDRLSSFGVYQLQNLHNSKNSSMLVSQILWYFVEGVNYRKNEHHPSLKEQFLKYRVPIDEEVLVFYKSQISGRWWIEIPYSSSVNNKLGKHTLLPCTYHDYLEACNQNIPERWWKARRKNEV